MKVQKFCLSLLVVAVMVISSIPVSATTTNNGFSIKVLVEPTLKYDEVNSFSEGLASVRNGNKCGFINSAGKEIISIQYDSVKGFSEGLAAARKDGKWGFIDKNGKIIIKFNYEDVGNFADGLAKIKKDGKWGFIDKTGKIIIQPIYGAANDFKEGLAAVYNGSKFSCNLPITVARSNPVEYDYSVVYKDLDGKWGFIDKTGKVVIPFEYDDISGYAEGLNSSVGFTEGLASMCKNMKWGYIDKNGEVVIPFKYDEAARFSEGLAYVLIRREANKGNVITELVNEAFVLENNCDRYYIDKTGKIIITLEEHKLTSSSFQGGFAVGGMSGAPFTNGLARIDINAHPLSPLQGTYRFIDKSGNTVIEFSTIQYNIMSTFDTNGLATVRKGDLYGFVDKTGKEVVPPIYSNKVFFNEGFAAVRKDGKWGIIQVINSDK